ncbi:hypothetical protein MMC29_003775 [Sticta canariensis]|nr:hypothetical protein [Sticta canariensis]
MEIDVPVLNEPGGVDDATAALILQLQYQDVEELLGTRKGKGRDGEQSDADLAMTTYKKELQDRITILADRCMSRSLAQAIVSDATILSESRAQENTAVKDRALALRLAEGKTPPVTSEQTTAADALDDSTIARLAALYVPDRSEDAPQDDDVAGAESSAWAGSRKKPLAVFHRRCTACDSEKSFFDVIRAPCGHDYCRTMSVVNEQRARLAEHILARSARTTPTTVIVPRTLQSSKPSRPGGSKGGSGVTIAEDLLSLIWDVTILPVLVVHNSAMFVAHAGNPVIVPSGTKIASPPVQTKSLPAIMLESASPENDSLIKLMLISENVMTAHIPHGVIFPDHTDVKNAITTFRNIFLSVGSAELWPATGADVIDYETLVKSF